MDNRLGLLHATSENHCRLALWWVDQELQQRTRTRVVRLAPALTSRRIRDTSSYLWCRDGRRTIGYYLDRGVPWAVQLEVDRLLTWPGRDRSDHKLPLHRALGQLLHRDVNRVGYAIGMVDGRCVTHIRYLSAPVAAL